jgi:hypothetical protein
MSTSQEVDQLYNILNADSVSPAILEGLKDFSAASKNQLVAHIAQTLEPVPSAKVLARLLFILTEENRAGVMTAFLVNLRSPYPDARRASLYGLSQLNYPGFIDVAILSLRDDSDQVLATACDLLLPKAKQEPRLWKILQDVYALHKGDPQFHMTMSLLEAHGIAQ